MKRSLLLVAALALVSLVAPVFAETPELPVSEVCAWTPGVNVNSAEPIVVTTDEFLRLLAPETGLDHPCLDCGGCCANVCGGNRPPIWCWTCC
ncbi:MAG: hypothetical protein SF066_13485 [Thermoanaerobaculia bacterium]|nr:hypothetical protein [Thermoanaerobaculia bacterium]